MLASVSPPCIAWARACAIEVSGVTITPLAFAPLASVVIAAVITSPDRILIVAPVAMSV